MARAAGSSSTYEYRLYNKSTGKYVKEDTIELESVTTVIKSTLASPLLVPWAARMTRDSIAGLLSVLLERADGPDEDGMDVLDWFTDGDTLNELLAVNRINPDDVRDEAGDEGTEGHAYLERLCDAQLESDEEAAYSIAERTLASKAAKGWSRAIAGWWLKEQPTILASEARVKSLRHRYAGTLDIVWIDSLGRVTLTDLKCRKAGRTPYESDHVQTGAYEIAWAEGGGRSVHQRSVLVAREDGTWIEEPSLIDPKTFLHLLETRRNVKAMQQRLKELSSARTAEKEPRKERVSSAVVTSTVVGTATAIAKEEVK